ncbi:MAG: AraC family transcriptional regulator ligand-binding domain-containing protein [Henriciella sp.]
MQEHRHPSSSYARILFRHLRLSETNSDRFLNGTQVSYDELMTLDGTIPRDDLSTIYRNALAISNIPELGLSVGAQLHMSTHGALGVATFSGPDLRTGMELLGRFGQTRADFFTITLKKHPKGLRIILTEAFDLADLREFVLESALCGIFSAITFFAGAGNFEGRVSFTYPKPRYWRKYIAHFGQDIKFNQAATEIIIFDSCLARPSPVPDPVLHQRAVALCEQHLQEIKAGEADRSGLSTEAAVTKLMYENPGHIWSLADVAAQLHISRRTLIRRLHSEGTKFQTIRDELAKKQVAGYLADTKLSVESIGYLMGFSDTSSFRRSFKRWFGETPSQYMARVRGPAR